ncbi:MAG: HEAT repeat domain-containing protein [Gammaproteobacteria bacterium]
MLSLLAQQADIQLVFDPAGSHVTLTAQFTDLALPVALKRLLRQQNYVLIYALDTRKSAQSPTPRVSELHILNASAPRFSELQPEASGQPVEKPDVLTDLLLALEAADTPAARIEVLEAIAANDLEQLLAVLSKALQENATAEAIAERLTALPAGLLSELVQTAPDASTRINALALLSELGQSAAETLAETLPEDAHVYAAQLLDAFHDEVFVPAIDSALLDDDPQVREAALAALENLPDTHADEELLSNLVLSDPVPELRLNALELLAETDRALALLQQALSDPDPRVSKAASTLLGNLKP